VTIVDQKKKEDKQRVSDFEEKGHPFLDFVEKEKTNLAHSFALIPAVVNTYDPSTSYLKPRSDSVRADFHYS
jgi:hypothetical protein